MPGTAAQYSSKKKRPLLAAYLVIGTNELMRRETLARLKGHLEPGFEVFNLDEYEASADLSAGELLGSLNTLPVGSGPRIVVIYYAERLSKQTSAAIVSYLENPNPTTTFCLVSDKLARNTRIYKAVAKLNSHAIINCASKKRWELPPVVARMAQVHGVQIDQDAIRELIDRVGESTTMLNTQVKTLAALCRASGLISYSDVEAHIAQTAEVKPWTFLDAVCERNAARALSLYHMMVKPSQIALSALLAMRMRELICAKSLDARGNAQNIAHELGKETWQTKNHLRWAQGFSVEDLRACLSACKRCERALKTGGDPETSFIRLVCSICRPE